MQVKLFFLFLTVILTASFSRAECRAVRWPYDPNISKVSPAELESVQRENLYSYLYFELSTSPEKRIRGLASKLFFYLKNTELNEDHYLLLQALEWAADLETSKPRVISEKELCSLENRLRREPSSVSRPKKTKSAVHRKKK